jgi:hypothetical protein
MFNIPICSMVLVYLPTKLGHFWGKCRCAYSSTMVRIFNIWYVIVQMSISPISPQIRPWQAWQELPHMPCTTYPTKIFHDIIIVSLDIIMIIRGISHYGTIVVSLTNIPLLWSYVSLAPPLLLPLVIKQWKILQKWRFIAWNKSIYI